MTITTIFFDLDETLYSSKAGLWHNIRERIGLYMRDRLNIPSQDVSAMRQQYLEQYGTTLLGLHHHYALDVVDFLDFVHDVPLRDYIQPTPELRTIIQALPARKFIFSNADVNHVQRVLTVLQLDDCFDGVLDILQMWPACKPMPVAFEMALKMAGSPAPEQCVLIDDLPSNTAAAREHGIFSILYGNHATTTNPNAAHTTLADWSQLPTILKQL